MQSELLQWRATHCSWNIIILELTLRGHQWSPDPGCNRCVECTLVTSHNPTCHGHCCCQQDPSHEVNGKAQGRFLPSQKWHWLQCKTLDTVCSHGHWDVNMCQYVSVRVWGYLQSEITQRLQLLSVGRRELANSYTILATIMYPVKAKATSILYLVQNKLLECFC